MYDSPPAAAGPSTGRRLTTDRRTFLKALGLAGAGVAGAAAFAGRPLAAWATTNAIDLGNKINSLVIGAHGNGWNWHNSCQMAQYYAEWAARGTESGIAVYGSATVARQHSVIASLDPSTAPPGSFSYYDYPGDGHVVTNIGNGYCINTSGSSNFATIHDFTHGLRITPLTGYEYRYLGWSHGNGANAQIDCAPWSPGDGGGGGGGTTWAFNPPDQATQKRIQIALHNRRPSRYDGLQDGVWGTQSIKGIQLTCKNVGYTGAVDGVPGPSTCHYVQVYAHMYGNYQGPQDSVLGPNSWNCFAIGLEAP